MLTHVSVTIFVWVGEEKVMMPIAPNEYFLDPLMSRMVSQEQFFNDMGNALRNCLKIIYISIAI